MTKFRFDYDVKRGRYILAEDCKYYSHRYRKWVYLPQGMESDGASGPASDIVSLGWWVHDRLCDTGRWADGAACSAWQRSTVLHDILREEGRWFRARSWWAATLLHEGWLAVRGGRRFSTQRVSLL
jgi:hypothetical protein